MSAPPVSTRTPRRFGVSDLRLRWCGIAAAAYEHTGLSCDRGPFALAEVLGIDAFESSGETTILEGPTIAHPPDLGCYKLAPIFYRAIAYILLGWAGEAASDVAVSCVAGELILPCAIAQEADRASIRQMNPYVAPELLLQIHETRNSSRFIPAVC